MTEPATLPFPHHGEAERWLPVPGWESLYDVSDLGRVRSLPRPTVSGVRGGRILKLGPSGNGGYVAVHLYRGNEWEGWAVHRLVLAAFVGPCPPGMEVLHGPGGKQDNRLINLQYGTHGENQGADRDRDGTLIHGDDASWAKLTEAIVRECRCRNAAGESQRSLAHEFGISTTCMSRAIRGVNWRRVA